MLNDASSFEKIYIACGYSDLRRGIDGFASLIQQEFKLDPFKPGILFLFCGRKTDRIKGLLWEGDGFLLLYKRLETGKFQWPRNEKEVKAVSFQQYKWLMEGLSIEQKKPLELYHPQGFYRGIIHSEDAIFKGFPQLLEIAFFLLFLASRYGILTIWIKNIQKPI